MAKQVIYRRGTTAEHANFVGANGEITVDTVKHVVIVHDGVTAGGFPLANASTITANISALTANAANQAAAITVLQANAATQSANIATLFANAIAQQANITAFTLASNSTVIFANIAGVRANVEAANVQIGLLFGNATIQSESITLANANITALQANIAAANVAIAGIVTGTTFVTQTAFANNLTAVNSAVSTQGTTFATNVAVAGIRANVTAANVAISALQASITAANVAIDNIALSPSLINSIAQTVGPIVTNGAFYSNSNLAGYLSGNITVGNIKSAQYNFANGVNILSTVAGTYSNANMASYLPTYTANIAANNVKNGNVWIFGTDGTTTFPTNISLGYGGNNVQFPRIIAPSGKAVSLQGQGSTGSAALAWSVDPDADTKYAAVGVSQGGGDNLAKVILTAGNTTPTLKVWKFDENGNITLPAGGTVTEGGGIIAGFASSPAPVISGFSSISAENFKFLANGVNILTTVAGTYSNANVAAYLTRGTSPYAGITLAGNVYAGPVTGSAAEAGFRPLTVTDLPNLSANISSYLSSNSSTNISTTGNVYVGGTLYVLGNVTQMNYEIVNNTEIANAISATGNVSTTANIIAPNYLVTGAGSIGQYTGGGLVGIKMVANSALGQNVAIMGTGNITFPILNYVGTTLYGATIGTQAGDWNFSANTGVLTLPNGAVIRDTAGDAVAFGQDAGLTTQGTAAVAIGFSAGATSQGDSAVAIGSGAGSLSQGLYSVAIGLSAGTDSQGARSVAIGSNAGRVNQGEYAVAIGRGAGQNNQGNNSIIINATSGTLNQTIANTFTVAPVRNDVANVTSVMFYNTTSKEITYGNTISIAGNINANQYNFANGVNILSTVAGTYSNANVASYLPTYSGNVRALNFVGAVQAQVGSSFAYATDVFGSLYDSGQVFLPADINSNAIVAGYTIVGNSGAVTLTVTSSTFIPGSPNFLQVATTPTASSLAYPVTVYSANYSPALPNSSLTVGNAAVASNVSIAGNLTVNGTGSALSRITVYGSASANASLGMYNSIVDVGAQIYLGDSNFNTSTKWNSAPGIGATYDSSYGGLAGALGLYTYAGNDNSRTLRVTVDAQQGGVQVHSNADSYSTTTGALKVGGGVGIGGNLHVSGNIVQQSAYYETYSNVTNSGGNLTCNFVNGSTFYATLTANVTVNFTNVVATAGRVTGATLIVDQGATAYRVANIQINSGGVQTVKYAGGTPNTGTASNTDVMSFSLISLDGTNWRVLGQISNYG